MLKGTQGNRITQSGFKRKKWGKQQRLQKGNLFIVVAMDKRLGQTGR